MLQKLIGYWIELVDIESSIEWTYLSWSWFNRWTYENTTIDNQRILRKYFGTYTTQEPSTYQCMVKLKLLLFIFCQNQINGHLLRHHKRKRSHPLG